jgi:hypothetical protein
LLKVTPVGARAAKARAFRRPVVGDFLRRFAGAFGFRLRRIIRAPAASPAPISSIFAISGGMSADASAFGQSASA